MEEIDHVAARVSLTSCLGGLAGVTTALLKGHPVARTAGLTAFSCALSATACFGAERLAAVSFRLVHLDRQWDRKQLTMASHAVAGAVGGGILGGLYLKRPARGIIFFVPLMSLVGFYELLYEDMRQERLEQLYLEEESRRGQSKSQ